MKMEVKDINNSVNPLLFNKNTAVAASGRALGAGFASLLGQTSMVMDILPVRPEVDVKPEVKTSSVDNRDVAVDDKKTPVSKADDKQNATSTEDKKTSKSLLPKTSWPQMLMPPFRKPCWKRRLPGLKRLRSRLRLRLSTLRLP